MNIAEALLAIDAGKVKAHAKEELEIPRLSEMFGEPFVLELKQIPSRRIRELQDMAIEIGPDGKPQKADMYKVQLGLLCDGIANRDFDNKEVLQKFKAGSRKDLFQILFNAGEIQEIADHVSNLCGFGKQATKKFEEQAEEVKN